MGQKLYTVLIKCKEKIKILIRSCNYFDLFLFIISIFMIINILVGNINRTSNFRGDSWSYYELSKNNSKDFYKVNTIRQFQNDGEYGISFPPLYPIIIFLINYIFNIEVKCTLNKYFLKLNSLYNS